MKVICKLDFFLDNIEFKKNEIFEIKEFQYKYLLINDTKRIGIEKEDFFNYFEILKDI